ncbi:MAG TPA: GNVR domain-containing protein [Ignavibacteriales bacterium]|nr:GNVR domain-containing protein [Ignavibacteriales bacterium]
MSKGFSNFINIILLWKRFIITLTILITILATIVAYLIPVEYKAQTVVTTPPENFSALSNLTGLMSTKSGGNILGAKMFGIGGANNDFLYGLLNSKTVLLKVAKKYNLFKYYKVDDWDHDKLLKKFTKDLSFEPNEFDFMEISVINKDPKLAADIANYFVYLLDSLNIKINNESARNNRIFIETRYIKNVQDMKAIEEKMYEFQKKYKVIVVPEQLEVSFKMAAELEAQYLQYEIQANLLKETVGENSPQYKNILTQLTMLKNKINELKNSDKISESNVLLPFKGLPDISIEYFRLYREMQIQSKIMEILLPMYEQAKVEENKSIPTVVVIDKAIPPSQKYYPKRAFIILAAFFLTLFLAIYMSISGYNYLRIEQPGNNFEQKMLSFYKKLAIIFKV